MNVISVWVSTVALTAFRSKEEGSEHSQDAPNTQGQGLFEGGLGRVQQEGQRPGRRQSQRGALGCPKAEGASREGFLKTVRAGAGGALLETLARQLHRNQQNTHVHIRS